MHVRTHAPPDSHMTQPSRAALARAELAEATALQGDGHYGHVPSRVLCVTAGALGTAKGCPWHASGSPAALLG